MLLNCMFSIRFWRDFSILILLSDIAISTFPLCLCVENTLSKSKLVTLLKWDVKFDTLVTHSVIFPRGLVHRVENRWGLTKVAAVLLNGLLW